MSNNKNYKILVGFTIAFLAIIFLTSKKLTKITSHDPIDSNIFSNRPEEKMLNFEMGRPSSDLKKIARNDEQNQKFESQTNTVAHVQDDMNYNNQENLIPPDIQPMTNNGDTGDFNQQEMKNLKEIDKKASQAKAKPKETDDKKKKEEDKKKIADKKKKKETDTAGAALNQQNVVQNTADSDNDKNNTQTANENGKETSPPTAQVNNNAANPQNAEQQQQPIEKKKTDRVQYWREVLSQNPSQNEAANLLVDLNSGKISESDFIQLVKELFADANIEKNKLALFLLRSHHSLASFEVLLSIQSKIPESLKTQLSQSVYDYAQASQVNVLNQILQAKRETSFKAAVELVNKAITNYEQLGVSNGLIKNRELRGYASSQDFESQNKQYFYQQLGKINETLKKISSASADVNLVAQLQSVSLRLDKLGNPTVASTQVQLN